MRPTPMRGVVDENHEPKRASDYSVVARINTLFLKYNWLIAVIVAIFVAFGFDWKTPKTQFEDLRAEIVANRVSAKAAIDSLGHQQDIQQVTNGRVVDILEIFSIDLCLRRKGDIYVYQRLRCDEVLKGTRPW